MNRIAAFLALAFALLVPAWGQSVSAKLYAKPQGEDLLIAIKVTPEMGSYFYDKSPDAGGKPTQVVITGVDGAEWTEVWFPEPKKKVEPIIGTSLIFTKKTMLYAAAKGAADADLSGLTVNIDGLACDDRGCLQFTESLTSHSAGSDAEWNGFPPALLVGEAQAPSSDGVDAAGHGPAKADAPKWKPFFGEEKAMARFFARVDDEDLAEVVIQIAVPEHFHMYGGPTAKEKGPGLGNPTVITITGGGVEWGEVQFPEPKKLVPLTSTDPENEWLWAYEGTFHFGVQGDALEGFEPEDIEIKINGQSCDDAGCIPIIDLVPAYAGEGDDALYAAAFASWSYPGEVASSGAGTAEGEAGEGEAGEGDAAGGDPASTGSSGSAEVLDAAPKDFGLKTTSDGFFAFLLLSITAGLITLVMPCTYPMIPITISYFTKQAEARNGNVLPLALVYGLGIVLIFVLIGVLFGPVIATFATHWITNLVIGTIFVVFALALFGMITLSPPAFMMNVAGSASSKGGYGGVFLMGLTLVVTSFTCTGPFVGSLLAGGGSFAVWQIGVGMGVFGATMATPFVFLALVPGKLSKMPSAGGWMNTVKVFMGFVELAASLKFFSIADVGRNWMILPRETFLALWAGIAFCAAMYLFGRINLKGESPDGNIGPGRMLAGVATVLGGLYCMLGVLGYRQDGMIMSALAPPPNYTAGLMDSHRSVGGGMGHEASLPAGVEFVDGAYVVEDDYDLARSFAKEKQLGLLLNFTGHN